MFSQHELSIDFIPFCGWMDDHTNWVDFVRFLLSSSSKVTTANCQLISTQIMTFDIVEIFMAEIEELN